MHYFGCPDCEACLNLCITNVDINEDAPHRLPDNFIPGFPERIAGIKTRTDVSVTLPVCSSAPSKATTNVRKRHGSVPECPIATRKRPRTCPECRMARRTSPRPPRTSRYSQTVPEYASSALWRESCGVMHRQLPCPPRASLGLSLGSVRNFPSRIHECPIRAELPESPGVQRHSPRPACALPRCGTNVEA